MTESDRHILGRIFLGDTPPQNPGSYGKTDCVICGHPLRISKRLEKVIDDTLEHFERKKED